MTSAVRGVKEPNIFVDVINGHPLGVDPAGGYPLVVGVELLPGLHDLSKYSIINNLINLIN